MKEGRCPTCQSDDLDYLDMDVEGESVGRNVRCRQCNTKFTEWYDLIYSETVKH